MPAFTMYITCAPHPDESVREDAIADLGGSVLLDDPVAPTYHTTTTAPTREAAHTRVSATLLAAGMQVVNIEFVPDDAAPPGADRNGGQSSTTSHPSPEETHRSVLARVMHWTALREAFTAVVNSLGAPAPAVAAVSQESSRSFVGQ